MAIQLSKYDDESELHNWVEKNIDKFFGDVIYLKGFQISTKRNKGAIPDGFILDLNNSSWTIIENELLSHGVWDHIAEQVIRFVVASQNDATKKKIRNKFFDELESKNLLNVVSEKSKIPIYNLLKHIENIIETNAPDIAIFIDDTNEDLKDMADALNASVKIFRIQKYIVNNSVEYLSPEGKGTVFETTPEEVKESQGKPAIAIEALGGGTLVSGANRTHIFKLNSGEKVATKYSKPYEDGGYWFGITPSVLNKYDENNVSHVLFILGSEGVVKLPIAILKDYLNQANTTNNADGTIRHYHIFIKDDANPFLYTSRNQNIWQLGEYYNLFQ